MMHSTQAKFESQPAQVCKNSSIDSNTTDVEATLDHRDYLTNEA